LATVVDAADLVVVIAPADVRSCAAAAVIAPWVSAANPNAGVVVRGPSPGGLGSGDVATIVGRPPLAAMRAQPGVADALERGGLRLRRRSPLAGRGQTRARGAAPAPGGRRASASLIDRVRGRPAAESGPPRPNVVAAAIRAESGGVLGDSEVLSSLRVLQTELTGAGILEPLLRADRTTDVLVIAPDAVWVDDGNSLRRSSIGFADDGAVRRLAQRLSLSAGRRLDEAQPRIDGQLTGLDTGPLSVRLYAVLPPIAADGTWLSFASAVVGHPGRGGADALGHHRASGGRAARQHPRPRATARTGPVDAGC
jgi:hypothetical protein